jgi:hypothetical protein
MNALKGLSASTALVLAGLAMIAAAPAAALQNTEICKVKEAKCSIENQYKPTLAAVVNSETKVPTEARFSMTGSTAFTCGRSVFEGYAYTHSEGALKGTNMFYNFTNCTEGWTLNPEKHEGYPTEIRAVSFGNGTMSILGSPMLIAEKAPLKCLYSSPTKSLNFTIAGGELAKMTANINLEKQIGSSAGCASKAVFTGTYEAYTFGLPHTPLFITE